MPLSSTEIVSRMWDGKKPICSSTTLVVVPCPAPEKLLKRSTASLDQRLGRWFRTLKRTKVTEIKVGEERSEEAISKQHYIRFNDFFVVHPGEFVIGNTLEWLRFPTCLSGYVTGKSSWGRRGLIIETAAGIHPGFTGCLTLEFANVGSAPIKLTPGMEICQLFFHDVQNNEKTSATQFVGFRKPSLGKITKDPIAVALETE